MLGAMTSAHAAGKPFVENEILAALNEEEFDKLRPFLSRVELKRRRIIFDANRVVDAVYFIESGLISKLARTQTEGPVEVAILGRREFVGLPVLLGSTLALHRTVVLVPGEALRIPANILQTAMIELPSIRDHLLRQVQLFIGVTTRLALCNVKHSLEQKVARWLLLAGDRVDGDKIPVTHDYLAEMLGARRPSVSEALSRLEANEIVQKSRASLHIQRKDLLRTRACRCYAEIEAKFIATRHLTRFQHQLECSVRPTFRDFVRSESSSDIA